MLSSFKNWLIEKLLGYQPLRAKVKELDDEGLYLWLTNKGDEGSVKDTILMAYDEEYNREPQATHIVASSVKEVQKLNKDRLNKMFR